MKTKAYIEDLKESIIDSNCEFKGGVDSLPTRDWLKFRMANRTITQPVWITKRIVIDSGYTVYNAKSRITLFLN